MGIKDRGSLGKERRKTERGNRKRKGDIGERESVEKENIRERSRGNEEETVVEEQWL